MWFYVNTLFDILRGLKVFFFLYDVLLLVIKGIFRALYNNTHWYRTKRYFTFRGSIELYLNHLNSVFGGLWSINWMVGAIEEIHFRWDCLIKLVLIFYLLLDGTIALRSIFFILKYEFGSRELFVYSSVFSKPLHNRHINYMILEWILHFIIDSALRETKRQSFEVY